MQKTLGVTGGIATGKSTVSKMIRDYGFTVIDADVAARKVVEPGEKAYSLVVEHFGEDILLENREIDRKKLGQIVFHNEDKRKLLNSIVHPEVRKWMLVRKEEAFGRGERAVFLDIPLLFESNLMWMVDQVIVVYTDEATQIKRLMVRNGLSEEEALARIKAQMPIEEKRKLGDAVIDNRGSLSDTKKQLESLLKRWNLL